MTAKSYLALFSGPQNDFQREVRIPSGMQKRMGRAGVGGRGLVVVWSNHKPCLASDADTWSARVESCGGSAMLMLPEEETVLRPCGDSSRDTISAPWSVRALACSRNISLCDSIGVLNLYLGVAEEDGLWGHTGR